MREKTNSTAWSILKDKLNSVGVAKCYINSITGASLSISQHQHLLYIENALHFYFLCSYNGGKQMQFKACDGALTLQESDVSSYTLVEIKVGV